MIADEDNDNDREMDSLLIRDTWTYLQTVQGKLYCIYWFIWIVQGCVLAVLGCLRPLASMFGWLEKYT